MAQIQAPVSQVCNLCLSEENVSWYCVNCDEILCQNCKIIHLRTKKNKNDKIVSLKEARNVQKSAVILCNDHPSTECTIYCQKCQDSVCVICLHNNHQDHEWTLLEKFITSKRESLKTVLNELRLVDPINSQAITSEGRCHGGLIKNVDDENHKIDIQEKTAKEKISKMCDRYRSELSEIKENENQRHRCACNNIESQNKKIQTTIYTTETAMDRGDLSQLIKAEREATQVLQEVTKKYSPPKLPTPRFIPSDLSDQAIISLIGVLEKDSTAPYNQRDNIDESESGNEENLVTPVDTRYETDNTNPKSRPTDQGARPKQRTEDKKQPKTQNQDRKREKKTQNQEPELRGDKTDRDREIDVTKVKVNSVIQVPGKSSIIMSIVPVDNNRMWVTQRGDRDLSLIDCHGKVIKKSVTVNEGDFIMDVKLYNSDLLVTCYKGQRVIRMSPDGSTTSTFSDISPYYTLGLCIGHSNDVLVICVKYTSDWTTVTESKIVRLNESGSIVLTIQHDHTGSPLFTDPVRLTSLPSGDIMVTDQYQVIAVDREGRHVFTWDGQKERIKGDSNSLQCITHDRHNHVFVTDYYKNKVYVIGREGRGGKCLLDSNKGILSPLEIARNHDGQLLVGCNEGKVHVIDY